jgi:hypothetical protein
LLLAAEPQVMIFVFATGYIVSGPVGEVIGTIRRRRTKHTEREKPVDGHDTHREDPR